MLNTLIELSPSCWKVSKSCPRKLLLPRLVVNWSWTTPSAPASAVRPAVDTVTSSTAPRRIGANTKKLVPPLRKRAELLLAPSSVMLIAPPGRPLYSLSRAPALVAAPGTSSAKLRMLRPAIGSLAISSLRTVLATVVEVVSTTGARASTCTSSVAPATRSCTTRSVEREVWTTTSRSVTGSNPGNVAVGR